MAARSVRIAGALLVALSAVWLWTTANSINALRSDDLAALSAGTLRGQSFSIDVMRAVLSRTGPGEQDEACSPYVRRDRLLVQLRLAEMTAQTSDTQQADRDRLAVFYEAQLLLACSPTAAVAWLGLYWATIRQDGLSGRALSYLRTSMRYAPHEAWIQLIRVGLTIKIVRFLPPDLQKASLADFDDLVKADLFRSAASIVKTAGTDGRATLLRRICFYPDDVKVLMRNFIADTVPGAVYPCIMPDRDRFGRPGAAP